MTTRFMFAHRYRNRALLVLGLARLALCPCTAAAEATGATTAYVGMYVNQIDSISLKDNQFTVDFNLWFRWKDGLATPPESFEVVGGRLESQDDDPYVDELGEWHYADRRIVANVTKFWNISRFPLDGHTLKIAIEDSDNEDFKLKYIA
ncbi:MAG: hypothetical protein ACREHD_18485, partial [Pirellulales bacterium]